MSYQNKNMLWIKRSLMLGLTSILLVACGGGGSGSPTSSAPPPPPPPPVVVVDPVAAGSLRVHFHDAQNDAAAWGVYAWIGPVTPSVVWITDRFKFSKSDAFGGYVDIPIDAKKTAGKFLITDGTGAKNCANDQDITFATNIATAGQEIWILPSDCTQYASKPAIVVSVDLSTAKAYWLTKNVISWPGAKATDSYKIYYAANGGITASGSGVVSGADGIINLTVDAAGLSPALKSKFVIAQSGAALKLSDADALTIGDKLRGQVVVAQFSSGTLITATSLQIAGVLDDLYASAAANANLGPSFSGANVPTFKLWAPTAKSVKLNIYPNSAATTASATQDMNFDSATGIWSYTANDASWTNTAYYTYSVKVVSRWASNTLVTNEVTDPYSVSLNAKTFAADNQHSFVGNLASSALKPAGWDATNVPALVNVMDSAFYELHVRDFSVSDTTVPSAHRGKFLAFTDTTSNGMTHLKKLQQSGLTHVHLLPAFDFASVNEDGNCVVPSIPAAAADSTLQQAVSRANDCFNWGYDPVHYNAPEGSYSSDASDAIIRVKEFRSMVKAMHDNGLRVVMDVVFNHTSTSKQNVNSVLDKIVPTYYYRLDTNGSIRNDSCCEDTAAENAMMAKLMIDSVKLWATQYQVDGFRFDIMGMHPVSVMTQLQTDVNAAAGREIYLYGEGWNFGAIANDKYFKQATQNNMFGTGIGTFNDRLRDIVRGGGCCDSGQSLIDNKGFVNGNGSNLYYADGVREGLSGTLKDFNFIDRFGNVINTGSLSQNAGYTQNPRETINYIEAHDNQTLFDVNAYKLPINTSKADRVRVQNLGNAVLLLSQGIPFIHAGQDILRSKSLTADSYDAGDWFNVLDFSYQSNNFGVGLPPSYVQSLMSPILLNVSKPDNASILSARDGFNDFLAIRSSSSLFRLRTGDDIRARLTFHNTGANQVAGVVVAALDGLVPSAYAAANYKAIVLVINANTTAKLVAIDALKNKGLILHPIQTTGADPVVKGSTYVGASGTFSVPPLTAAVFVIQ